MFIDRPKTDGSTEKVARGPSSQSGLGAADHIVFDEGVDVEIGRAISDPNRTYIALRNTNGTKIYFSPNAAGTGLDFLSTRP